jgi:protein O-GlcNAc transferase
MSEINELNRAIALYRQGILEESESILNQLVNVPSLKETCHYYLGLIKIGLQKHTAAINHLDQAIASNPTKPEYLFNKAISLGQLGDYKTCLEILGILEKKLPNSSTILFNKAVALGKIGDRNSEFSLYRKILSTEPSNQEALNNIAVCCNELNQTDQALSYINFLLSINPDHLSALKTKADIFQKLGDLSGAHQSLVKYLQLAQKGKLISGEILTLSLEIIKLIKIPSNYSSIGEIDTVRNQVEIAINTSYDLLEKIFKISDDEFEIILSILIRVNLFYLAYQQRNDREINENFCKLITLVLKHRIPPFNQSSLTISKKIKLGVLSRFKYHVDTDVLAWIKKLPLDDYELIFIRLNGEPVNVFEGQIKALGTIIESQLDEASLPRVIHQVRELNLDALFLQDTGMTSDGKLLANVRLAPIQFTNWSHPITSGSKVIDFYLSSDLMEPDDAQDQYTEKLIRLPNLGLYIPKYELKKSSGPGKVDVDRFYVGCLQSLFKYLPQDDDVFVNLCKKIPTIKLIFIEDVTKTSTEFFINRLRKIFSQNNLNFDYFVHFSPRIPHDQFMNLMNMTHIELDSIGWSGGNTSLQALFLGKPILTIRGQYMRGRHTSAMLDLLNLNDLKSFTSKDCLYEMAVKLNENRHVLISIGDEIL